MAFLALKSIITCFMQIAQTLQTLYHRFQSFHWKQALEMFTVNINHYIQGHSS